MRFANYTNGQEVSRTEVTMNEFGKTSVSKTFQNGSEASRIEYEYDQNGNLVKVLWYTGTSLERYKTYTWYENTVVLWNTDIEKISDKASWIGIFSEQ